MAFLDAGVAAAQHDTSNNDTVDASIAGSGRTSRDSESDNEDIFGTTDGGQEFKPAVDMHVAVKAVHFDPDKSDLPMTKATDRWSYKHFGRMRGPVGWRTAEVTGKIIAVNDSVITVAWGDARGKAGRVPEMLGTTDIDLEYRARGCEHQIREHAPPLQCIQKRAERNREGRWILGSSEQAPDKGKSAQNALLAAYPSQRHPTRPNGPNPCGPIASSEW